MKTKVRLENNMLTEYDFDDPSVKENRLVLDYHISVTLDSDVAGVFKTQSLTIKL